MAEIDLIKISELPATSTIGDTDELAVVQDGATKKVPYSVLKDGAEVTPDTTLSEAGVPADAAAVGAALAQKANQAAVTQALDAKADKTEVAGISGDIEELASVVESKADKTALNKKADRSTTNALRQDLTTLYGIVNQKADKTELNAQIGNVTAELASKANTADVNNLLAAKANVASPVFTGRPQAPTAAKGTATPQLATTAFVQNAIDDKQDALTFDTTPTENSQNPVTSYGVWQAELKNVHGSGIIVNSEATLVAPYDDLNTLPPNTIVSYSSPSYFPANAPSGLYSGFSIATLSRSNNGKYASATMQILVGRVTGGATRSELYHRISWGGYGNPTWSDWKQAETAPTSFMGINLSMFERVGVIGDSFASGSSDYNHGVTNYPISWLQIMKRMHGWTEADNYSVGGLTTRTWLTNSNGLTKLQNSGWKQLYFIALGINDSNPNADRNVPIGVIADFNNTTTPPDTFYGNMGQIYRAIKAKNSGAVVCFITIPRFDAEGETPRYAPYDVAIKAMASATHSVLIDSNTIGLFHLQSWTNNLASSHPTAPLYSAMAKAYSKAFEDAALANIGYLKTYNGYLNDDPTATESDDIGE
jgi:hypothetical protein